MAGMVILAVFGGFISFGCFVSGMGVYGASKSAIHEIYAALLILTSVLGLVIMTVAAGAAVITGAIRRTQDEATVDRRKLADALRAVAEYRRAA
jgi:hypothetical protein